MKDAVVVFSGGQDSTTCLFWAIEKWGKDRIAAVTFDYGQRHHREIESAYKIALLAGITKSHEVIRLPDGILKGTSPLVSGAELEQYEDAASLPGGLEKTFVPMRNQFFLTLAANRAYALGAPNLVTGVSSEDYGGYPDCREPFIRAFEDTSNLGTFTGEDPFGPKLPLKVHTPLMYLDKADTVHLAKRLSDIGCWEALAWSHTAYDGEYPPTGKDHASLLRAKGFELAGYPDPLVLRAFWDGLMPLPETPNYRPSGEEGASPSEEEASPSHKSNPGL